MPNRAEMIGRVRHNRHDFAPHSGVQGLRVLDRLDQSAVFASNTSFEFFPFLISNLLQPPTRRPVYMLFVSFLESGYCWRIQSQPHKLFKFGRIKRISSLFGEFANSIPLAESSR